MTPAGRSKGLEVYDTMRLRTIMWWIRHRRWIKAPLRLIPVRRCMFCGKVFIIPIAWWISYARWSVPEFCSQKCADDEIEWVDAHSPSP